MALFIHGAQMSGNLWDKLCFAWEVIQEAEEDEFLNLLTWYKFTIKKKVTAV